VIIQVRDMPISRNNPYSYEEVRRKIIDALRAEGFTLGTQYEISSVPNIVDISYGRSVGYTFTEHNLGEEIHNISATKIRRGADQ